MKNKLKIVSFLLLMSILDPINSMKRDRDEDHQEENKEDQRLKKQKQESTGQEVFNRLNFNNNNLPVEVIINILEYSLTEIINKSDIFNWVGQVLRFANNMSLVNENFRDAINYIIKKGYDKKIAKNRFASGIKTDNKTFLNNELKRKITGICDDRSKSDIAKLIISGVDPRVIIEVNNGINFRPLTIIANDPKWAQLSNLLIKYDPDIKTFPDLADVIHFACKTDNLSLIRKLINNNIVIDDIILKAAILSGNYQAIKLLISDKYKGSAILNYFINNINKITINIKNLNKIKYAGATSILENALAKEAFNNILELLMKKTDLTVKDAQGNTPLLLAIKKNDISLIEKLIEFKKRDSYINIQDNNGQTPLIYLAVNNMVKMSNNLIRYYPNLNIVDKVGRTALIVAVLKGYVEIVKLLLAHNANVDAVCENNLTALMIASAKGHVEIAKLLLAHNANVDSVCENSYTALMIAAAKANAEIVKLLLAHNANVNAADKDGYTALMKTVSRGYVKIVELLLAHNANVNAVGENSYTALMIAASKGHVKIVELLLARNANVNAVTKYSNTALIEASFNGHLEIVRSLILAGADVNMKNDQNKSAKDLARERNHQAIVNLLDDYEKSNLISQENI